MVLWIAFASLFAVMLGYSRVPYAAAVDGSFFKIFAKLHPVKMIPHVSLLFIAALGFVFSLLFKLSDIISAILAMRILIQFVAQAIGVVLLRKKNATGTLPFRMWLYPLPVVISIICWLFIFYSTGHYAWWGVGIALMGVIVFQLTKKTRTTTIADTVVTKEAT